MRLHLRTGILAAVTLLAGAGAQAATFRGRNVDGHWYSGSAFNQYAGLYEDVRIKFAGETVFVRLASGTQLVLALHEEAIADPNEIEAEDHRRGLHWILKVQSLGSR